MNEVLLMDAERQKLTGKCLQLQRKKSKLELRVHSQRVFHDFLERVVKLSKFEEVLELVDHLESLLYFRDQLFQRDNNNQDQLDTLRTELVTLEDQSHLMMVHWRNQLSHLENKLEMTHSEAFQWEQKWNHIEETAAKKTLLLGKIKIGTLNLCEMIGSPLDTGEKGVDVNDTDTQLDRIQEYIQDHHVIVKLYRSTKDKKTTLS
uniref:Uncharacterized protein n=1 Tax=Neogobius melanostomus TaxID=47308 RepID=A0A8C6TJY1_9GOBI